MNLRLLVEVSIISILLVATITFAFRSFIKASIHDVAVVDVYPDLISGHIIGVVKNEGTQTEYSNITAYCNETSAETRCNVSLDAGASRTLSFSWNTTSLLKGKYLLRVVAGLVQDETDSEDNSFTYAYVEIVHARDVSITDTHLDMESNIVVNLHNKGYMPENLTVIAYYNLTRISEQNIIQLPPNSEKTIKFPWDTTFLPNGRYNLSVVSSTVPDETNTADNSFSFMTPIPVGSKWAAAEYFNFTAISAEASGVWGGGEIQIVSLHFNVTAIRGDAHNVTISIMGNVSSRNLFGILYKASERVDVYFETPYQTRLMNATYYPVNVTVFGNEIDPERQQVTLQVPPTNGSSYTIWRGADHYYAKNDWSGIISYYGTNFTYVFQQALNAFPENSSGTINLESGFYEGWLLINRSGVTVQGEGVFDYPEARPNGPRILPDDSPDLLMGTVLKVNVVGKDGIHLKGQLRGVQIKNLGIEFTRNMTGNGISDDMDQNYHLSWCVFDNIMILNHDRSHYAIQLSNFLHLDVSDIWSWGGPLLNLYINMGGYQDGNSNFYNMYGYIKYDLAPVGFVEGPYPIFIHKNDSLSSAWLNFLQFYRIQINCPFTQTDSDFCVFTLWDCRFSTINGLDLEGSGHAYEGNKLQMGSCYNVQFNSAYMWSMINNVYVNIASNNEKNTFENCWICGGSVLDSAETDVWRGCKVEGTISPDSLAHFTDLTGNSDAATFVAGSIELNITAKFVQNSSIITVVHYPNGNQTLTVIAKYQAPSNTFTVECTDGQPAIEDITFFWTVQS